MTFEPERRSDEPVEAMRVVRRSCTSHSGEIPVFFFICLGFVIIVVGYKIFNCKSNYFLTFSEINFTIPIIRNSKPPAPNIALASVCSGPEICIEGIRTMYVNTNNKTIKTPPSTNHCVEDDFFVSIIIFDY